MLQCSTHLHGGIIGKFHRQFRELRHFLYLCPSSLRRGISHSREFSICNKFYFVLRAISYPYMIPRSEGNQLSELPGRKFTRPAGVMHDIRTESAKKNGSKIANICMHQPAELHLSISKANPTVEHPLDGPSTGLFASAMHGDCVGRSMFHPGMEMAAFVENNIEPHILAWNYWPIGLLNPKLVGNNREVRKAQKPLRVHA